MKKIILFSLSFYILFTVKAQTYNFSSTTGTYSNLTGSISLNNTSPWDDPEFTIPIGFNFQYFNTTITEFSLFGIGDGADLSTQTIPTGTLPILLVYGADIADRGYDDNNQNATTGSLSNISYLLEGTVGNRILKIEWNNVGFYEDIIDDDISTDFTNFQLWLFEGSNAIEIHFGPNSITQPSLDFDNETGARIGLVENYNFNTDTLVGTANMLDGNPSNPMLVNTTDPTLESNYLNGVIPNGTIYRFENTSLSIEDFTIYNDNISLYPNPASNYFSITSKSKIETITLYNVSGTKIKTIDYDTNEKVDISNLNAGLYFASITSPKGTVTKKIIKQ